MTLGQRYRSLLNTVAQVYGVDIEVFLKLRGHTLWIVEIDRSNLCFHDLLGNIDPSSMDLLNTSFEISVAGFRASAQEQEMLKDLKSKVDILLMNATLSSNSDNELIPIIAHELNHYFDQTTVPDGIALDDQDVVDNADIIDQSFEAQTSNTHPLRWGKLMAWSARECVHRGIGGYPTVRAFLEQAIPEIDRVSWHGDQIREPDTLD